jgi:L,D-peptidoglycan transpeptidase YkuD (ErfK/YbiS/YcfS/YnhG family)
MDLKVYSDTDGTWLDWSEGRRRCAIGRGGIAVKQREGDGITPLGAFPLREIFYRADRIGKPDLHLPLHAIGTHDGWCDAPDDANYNRLVTLPYSAGAEALWRDDHLYDLFAVLGYNDTPIVPGKGSAIFLHVAGADYSPTEGCVALSYRDALAALTQIWPGDKIVIG